MRHLILLNDAKKDLVLIKKYTFEQWGKSQGLKYLKELKQTIKLINANPNIGTTKVEINPNFFCFPQKSHVIYYIFNAETTWIVRVLHKNMLPKLHLEDSKK